MISARRIRQYDALVAHMSLRDNMCTIKHSGDRDLYVLDNLYRPR